MAWWAHRMVAVLIATSVVGISACDDDDPVARVVLTSPSGFRLAVGRTVQLAASAFDASDKEISGVTFKWTSSRPEVAGVDTATGLVIGRSEGTATITAEAMGKSKSVVETVLAVDFDEVRGLLGDSLAVRLLRGLTNTARAQLEGAVNQAKAGMDSGDFDTMEAAIAAARSAIVTASDPTDRALGATFALFVDQAFRRLKL